MAGGGCAAFFVNERGAFLDELRHDAHRNFLDALGLDRNADGTGDALQLFRAGDFFLAEMVEDDAGLARAANHAEKKKGLLDPMFEHEGVVAMTARDEQGEGGRGGRRQQEQFFPGIHARNRMAGGK